MKTWKIITISIFALAVVALTSISVFAFMGKPGYYTPNTTSTSTAGTTGNYVAYPSSTTPFGGFNGGYGGMMGGGRGCGNMMSRFGYGSAAPASPTASDQINISAAVAVARNYVASTGNSNLEVSQVEEYSLNFYALVKEKDTGIGAFELLIDKYNGAVSPEMGPKMMWNTKYGMGSGMMGWPIGSTTAPATVTVDQAKANAIQFLNAYYPGTMAGDVQAFYGYYRIEVLASGYTCGMLSVNGYTGQVWYHTWHGTFIQEWHP